MTGALCLSPGSPPVRLDEFQGFARHFGIFPRVSDALWFYSQMVRWKQLPAAASTAQFTARARAARRGYRPDLYGHALQSLGVDLSAVSLNGGVDHRGFDPQDLDGYLYPP